MLDALVRGISNTASLSSSSRTTNNNSLTPSLCILGYEPFAVYRLPEAFEGSAIEGLTMHEQ